MVNILHDIISDKGGHFIVIKICGNRHKISWSYLNLINLLEWWNGLVNGRLRQQLRNNTAGVGVLSFR